MEPRDDVDAATGPADATTALQSAHTASIDLAHAVTTLATPVSSQAINPAEILAFEMHTHLVQQGLILTGFAS